MSRMRKKSVGSSGQASKKQKTLDLGWKNSKNDDDSDHHIDSDEEEDSHEPSLDDEKVESDEEETVEAKKIRLAKQYLTKLKAGESSSDSSDDSEGDDDDDGDDGDNDAEHDRIGVKLQRERLKREGTLERLVADKVGSNLKQMRQSLPSAKGHSQHLSHQKEANEWISSGYVKLLRGHDLTPTCVALQASGEKAISGSKDHSVILWDVENQRKDVTLFPTWKKNDSLDVSRTLGEILSVACSDDGRYAAIGKRDSTVSILDIRLGKNKLVKTFEGHKGPVTSLAFRTQSLQLFSGSDDRCIRHYNLGELMYVETLYGHQFGVTGIDCHRKERPVSVSRDRTARAWKLADDTHLIFRGGAKVSSADCITAIKDDWFLTGHDDGNLGLWMTEKKKAVKTIEFAHGAEANVGRGISALGSLPGSDFAVSGSHDGYLRLWKVMSGITLDSRGLEPLAEIPLAGYINGVAIGPKARFGVFATGQEPRLGRWNRIAKAKNRFGIVTFRADDAASDQEDEYEESNPAAESEEENADSDSS